jgi:hypothetical protein
VTRPLPIQRIPRGLCRSLQILFTDLDDTLTRGGLIPAGAFQALWRLHGSGVAVVVVTGRPAGWCDHIARMWPVEAVIGENGAFYYRYDRGARRMERRYLLGEEERRLGRQGLERIRRRVLAEVPGCGIASDQPFRLFDLAIDFREDVEPLGDEQVDHICRIAREEGACCKVSSIHVNCWYGDFDKVAGVRALLADSRGRSLEESQELACFVGDSPNDEPLFAALRHSIGVANLRPFLPRIRTLPRYITEREAADGFLEAAEVILAGRPGPEGVRRPAEPPEGARPAGGP